MKASSKVEIYQAGPAEAGMIAETHLDSIRSVGAKYYSPDIVDDWAGSIRGDRYLRAMTRGDIFFIAIGDLDGTPDALGFSSYRHDGQEHRTAVYVRGRATRAGVGSALLRSAEGLAVAAGASHIDLDASLAAVDFYKANGFTEIGRGDHRLRSGRTMTCVFMRKTLRA